MSGLKHAVNNLIYPKEMAHLFRQCLCAAALVPLHFCSSTLAPTHACTTLIVH